MDQKTKEIQDWWNQNPFTLGVAGDYKSQDLVGRVSPERMNLHFFQEIERKFRKHSGTGAQSDQQPLLAKLLPYSLNGKKVLDIATGSGIFAADFAKNGAQVTAIDLTEYAVMEAKTNLKLNNLSGEVLQMDAQHLTFPDNSFDFVNAWGCLMHMPDTEGAIKEINRVLKPGGGVLTYMYNKSSWPFWFNIIILRGILGAGFIRYGSVIRLTSRYSDGASNGGNMLTKFYTPKEAARMFSDAGFRDVRAFPWDIGHEPDHWPMRSFPVFKFLPTFIKAWMSKRWGYGLIIQAQK